MVGLNGGFKRVTRRMSTVQRDAGLYDLTSKDLGNGVTAAAGVADGLRPAGALQYEKVTVEGNTTTTVKGSVMGAAGKGVNASGYAATSTDYKDGDTTFRFQKGAGFSYGSSLEVTAGVRGDYIRKDGEGLSPYFTATATGGSAVAPSARLEVGACQKVGLGALGDKQVCAGVSQDSNGSTRTRMAFSQTF